MCAGFTVDRSPGSLSHFIAITERNFISMPEVETLTNGRIRRKARRRLRRKSKETSAKSSSELYDAVFRATSFSLLLHRPPFVTSAFDRAGVLRATETRSRSISMPRHACRATASPLILRLRLWFKLPVRISMPGRTFGALLLRTAPPLASGPSPSRLRTADAINDETGMTRCLAMKSMHFIDRCFPVAAVYWQ